MAEYYHIFNTILSCEFPLPELPYQARQESLLSAKLGEGDLNVLRARGFETVFEWHDTDGGVVCWCERNGDEYLYTFTGVASFHISSSGVISCYLEHGSRIQMMRHLLLNQIIPRYLASTGRLLVHAGAVTLKNRKSVAFLGNSGFGKSTLVSGFHQRGATLINDDCILLEHSQGVVTVIGGLVGIRLFPDSVHAVFNESTGFTHYTPYSDKQQWILNSEGPGAVPKARKLDAMFVLNDALSEPVDKVHIDPVSGSQAMMAMIQGSFSLDPSDRSVLTRNFRNAGQAISGRLKSYSLKYPRIHDQLPQVLDAVTECVS